LIGKRVGHDRSFCTVLFFIVYQILAQLYSAKNSTSRYFVP
jgi:hypothetical protein